MKKSLLALAVLSAFAGAASAQSSVTLSGIVDAGIRGIGSDESLTGSQSGYNAFTLSGREDLGGGMVAFFTLNHRFQIQNGRSNTSSAAPGTAGGDVFWRNSFVGLSSNFGDIRLGRMLMPLQDMNGGFDAFDTGYAGGTHTGGLTATVRANSTVYYRSPTFAGFKFEGAYASAAGQTAFDTQGSLANGSTFQVPNAAITAGLENPLGLSLRWSAGPFSVGAAFDENVAGYETYGLYGSWNGGFINLYGQWEHGAVNNAAGTLYEKIDVYSISAKFPMGAFTWKVGYVGVNSDRANADGYKIGGGVEYALSKRTSLYSTIGSASGDRVDNRLLAPVNADDFRYDVGITHRF